MFYIFIYKIDNLKLIGEEKSIKNVCNVMMNDTIEDLVERLAEVTRISYGTENCLDISYTNMISYYKNIAFNRSNPDASKKKYHNNYTVFYSFYTYLFKIKKADNGFFRHVPNLDIIKRQIRRHNHLVMLFL